MTAQYDVVNKPRHYNVHPSGIECKEVTKHMSFYRGSAVKYLWRCEEKGEVLQDLEKAYWYVSEEINDVYSSSKSFLGSVRFIFSRVARIESSVISKVCDGAGSKKQGEAMDLLMRGGSQRKHLSNLRAAEVLLWTEIQLTRLTRKKMPNIITTHEELLKLEEENTKVKGELAAANTLLKSLLSTIRDGEIIAQETEEQNQKGAPKNKARNAKRIDRITAQGLKDHEIALLVNAVRDALLPITSHQCLRAIISETVTKVLDDAGRRIDA